MVNDGERIPSLQAGSSRLTSLASASTDDLGQFRLFDLGPGEYFVAASPAGQGSFVHAAITGERRFGYAPTYYPTASTLQDARSVIVGGGQDTAGVDFALVRVQMGRVLGTALDSAGSPLAARGSVSLRLRGDDQMASMRGGPVLPDGTFIVSEVPPGDYHLLASVTRGESPSASREAASVPVTVNGDDVTVDIQTNTGATIAGRIVIEGSTESGVGALDPPAALPFGSSHQGVRQRAPQVQVSTRPGDQGTVIPSFSPGRLAPANADSTFEINGVRGTVLLTASGGRATLKAILYAGQGITGTPIELAGTEQLTDIDVVLTTDTGRVEGTVIDGRGQPVAGAWVIVFADDPARWFLGSPFVCPTRTSGVPPQSPGRMLPPPALGQAVTLPGQFSVSLLVPGRYAVVAIDGGPDDAGTPPTDRDSLATLRAKATTVTVAAAQSTTVRVRLVK